MGNIEFIDAETTTTTESTIQPEPSLRLAPPWSTFYTELKLLFGEDPEIQIGWSAVDENTNIVRLRVENPIKAEALSAILPAEKVFGNVTVKVDVIPANEEASLDQYYKIAFGGNPVVTGFASRSFSRLPGMTYVLFRKEVVQYYADNLSDPYGNRTTLFENIARNIFEGETNIRYATDPHDPGPKTPTDAEDRE